MEPEGREGASAVDFEQFFALSLDLMGATDTEGRLFYVNRAWTGALGYERAELLGRPVLELVHPDDVATTRAAFERLADGGQVVDFENRYRHRDGSYRDLAWTSWAHPGSDVVYGVARDVTGRRRAERERRSLHVAWRVVAEQRTLHDLVATVAEETRRMVGARGVVTTVRGADVAGATRFPTPVLTETSGQPGEGDPGVTLELRGRGATGHGTVEVWFEDGTVVPERTRRLLGEFAEGVAVTVERAAAEHATASALVETRELLDSISDAFYGIDDQWRFTYVNRGAERLLRRRAEELVGREVWSAFPEAVGSPIEQGYRTALATGVTVNFVTYYPPLERWFEIRAHPREQGLAVYFIDVTDAQRDALDRDRWTRQQSAVADLGRRALAGPGLEQLAEETVQDVVDVLEPLLVVIAETVSEDEVLVHAWYGSRGRVAHVARVRCRDLAGTAVAEAVATGASTRLEHGPGSRVRYPGDDRVVRVDAAVPILVRNRGWGVLAVTADRADAIGEPEMAFLRQVAHVLSSTIERERAEGSLREQAERDALTRLPNRTVLRRTIELAVEEARAQGHTMALCLLDLDGFKDVNDSLGHAAGDELLQQLGARLAALIDGRGTVARLGGDEFGICIPGPATVESVAPLAEEVLRAVEQPVALGDLDVSLSGSLGVVTAPTATTDVDDALQHADVAMYRAKETAGRRWVAYDPDVDAPRAQRLALTTDMRVAVRAGEIFVHYQPVVDLLDGRTVSAEALARWSHPTRGSVPPDQFVPLAEQTGLIGELTLAVLRQADLQARRWKDEGVGIPVAVNISAVALVDPGSSRGIIDLLVGASDRLTAEITESALVDERARVALRELADGGVRCAVDDYGTGYSALTYLRKLPVASLKIDRTFVADLGARPTDLAVLRSVIDLGDALGLDVVAEGVETQDVATWLRDAGVRRGQGFLWARPMSAEAMGAWLHGSAHAPS